MPTSLINLYTSPESTGKPVVHEDLVKIINQMAQGDVMRFTTAANRTSIFATLGTSPPVGSLSVLTSTGVVERWNGSTWVAASIPSGGGINSATGAGTTVSAAYVDFPSPSSFSYNKLYTSTLLKITLDVQSYSSGASTVGDFAVRVAAADYDIARAPYLPASTATMASGIYRVPGLAAGSYLIQVRWRRSVGAGTLTVDANDWISVDATEVQP